MKGLCVLVSKKPSRKKMAKNKLTQFEPPTLEQVQAYFNEIGVQPSNLEAQKFIAHHETRGWKLRGNIQMVSWKGACQTWRLNKPQIDANPYQGKPNQNYAPTGQAKAKINYVKANTEEGVPCPEEYRTGLFGKLVDKFTGKTRNDRPDQRTDTEQQ